jgi:hypothetical protein
MGRAYGMSTRDGEEAVQALVDAVVADAGLEVDFTVIARRLNDGVELIGSYHPEVYSPIVVRKIEDRVSQGIAERLINSGRR